VVPVKSSDRAPANLLELKPRRNVEWVIEESGRAVLLVPKFRNPLLRSWLLPLLARPEFRVRLDAMGTAFWERCDGSTPVLKIAEEMSARSGSDVEDMIERLCYFLRKLEREDFVDLGVWRGDRAGATA
jgi:Coenzyme PQQ synthesis protein D (PqqD)